MATAPRAGRGGMDSPQEIVRQLLGCRLLERHHSAALRIHRTQNVVDRSVLSAAVHGLQADQERAPTIGVEQLLKLPQLLLVMLDLVRRFLVAIVVIFERRVDVLELDLACRAAL